jgi:DNA end-binding protein Ku
MRSIWSGAISFGLIYIPVRLYTGAQDQSLSFNQLRRGDNCRIRYVRVCKETGEEVPYEDIVKGYEYKKGEYVVLEDEDFERANLKKSKTIEIVNFVDSHEVDEKFLEKPYYLEPDKGAQKVYTLLREALKQSKKVGIARFVLRTREHMALLKAEEEVIVLNQMRFANEVRSPEGLDLPKMDEKVNERELEMAVKLVDQLSESWDPEQYKDTYTEDLMRIIQEKLEGKELEPLGEEPEPIEVTDLFAKLSESLEMAQGKRGRK